MTSAASTTLCALLVVLLPNDAGAATLVEADDPRYGAHTLTIDTTSGLAWLDVSLTTGWSHLQVLAATHVGGAFEGFRCATAQEVVALFASAGVPGVGFYPDTSPSMQPILAVITLVGATSSQSERPGVYAMSGTELGANTVWGLGATSVSINGAGGYLVSGPGAPAGLEGTGYGYTTSYSDLGNWLVRPVPEASPWRLGVVGVLTCWGWRWATRHNQSRQPTAAPPRHLRTLVI
jgi:hypothetical protein